MQRKPVRGRWVHPGVLLLGILAVGLSASPAPSGVPPAPLYLELTENPVRPSLVPLSFAVPPPIDGSIWNELYPTANVSHLQTSYMDGGDNLLSIGDVLRLNGMEYRIIWAGPTYFVTVGSTQLALEPNQGPHNDMSPVGEVWQEIQPNFGSTVAITSWSDNGTGVIDPTDDFTLVIDGGSPIGGKVDRVGINITVEPLPAVPVAPTHWGGLKSLFGAR